MAVWFCKLYKHETYLSKLLSCQPSHNEKESRLKHSTHVQYSRYNGGCGRNDGSDEHRDWLAGRQMYSIEHTVYYIQYIYHLTFSRCTVFYVDLVGGNIQLVVY